MSKAKKKSNSKEDNIESTIDNKNNANENNESKFDNSNASDRESLQELLASIVQLFQGQNQGDIKKWNLIIFFCGIFVGCVLMHTFHKVFDSGYTQYQISSSSCGNDVDSSLISESDNSARNEFIDVIIDNSTQINNDVAASSHSGLYSVVITCLLWLWYIFEGLVLAFIFAISFKKYYNVYPQNFTYILVILFWSPIFTLIKCLFLFLYNIIYVIFQALYKIEHVLIIVVQIITIVSSFVSFLCIIYYYDQKKKRDSFILLFVICLGFAVLSSIVLQYLF